MTLEELSALDPDLLAAALYCAQKREREAKLDTLPKCKCGARATQLCVPAIRYEFAAIHVNEEAGYASVGDYDDDGNGCPGADEPDDGVAWVCCDKDSCVQSEWRSIRYADLRDAVRHY